MFGRLFNRSGSGESDDFRSRVIRIAKELYPEIRFKPNPASVDVIFVDQVQIGLQNLKAKYEQSDQSENDLRELIKAHFEFALDANSSKLTFEEAQKSLRPQIMPPEYARQAPIVMFPMGRTLAIGLVLDQKHAYSYVRIEDAARWGKSHRELLNQASSNLEEASRNMQMQYNENAEVRFVGIETKDGFDAARILMPRLQEFLSGKLGSPFHFGVPNRDFLICWNREASPKFMEFTRDKLLKDFRTQPYPLSSNVFTLGADGMISENVV